jgi:uncharacterized coiled-coil protein SlyX
MSGAAKIATFAAALGGVFCVIFAFLIVSQKDTFAAARDDYNTKWTSTKTELVATKKDLTQTKTDLTDKQAKLDETTSKLTSAESNLMAQQKKAGDLENLLKDKEAELARSKGQMDELLQKFGDQDPANLLSNINDLKAKLDALEGERKILDDQLQGAKQNVAMLEDALKRKDQGTMPPGISGKIETVNRKWNFVVLNVGVKDGVVPNGVLIVYRGNNFVGKVKVVTSESSTSVADILPEWHNADIQSGDSVLN